MSLWTPSGEHEVPSGRDVPSSGAPPAGSPIGGDRAGDGTGDGTGRPPAEEVAGDEVALEQLRRELASAPAEVVLANHCYGLFELAAVYLSESPPRLDAARLTIDGFGALVDSVGDRLGEAGKSLKEALAQIRMAYVQLDGADSP